MAVLPDFDLPLTHRGQTVGLLGGSFDPAHAGHAHVTRHALKLFALDQVWWLVSPGNPLKPRGPAPLPDRLARARQVMQHPRVHVSDFEAQAHTRYTAETLRKLLAARPDVRFVWLMGADNLAQFHLWQDWRGIMETVPVGVVARPGLRMTARQSYAASVYARARLPAAQSRLLARRDPPCWCFVNLPMMAISSTGLRAAGEWQAKDAR